MSDLSKRFRRGWKAVHRRAREIRMIARGLASTDHPVLAHIIPMRRCNLACTYCNEYDDVSKPGWRHKSLPVLSMNDAKQNRTMHWIP